MSPARRRKSDYRVLANRWTVEDPNGDEVGWIELLNEGVFMTTTRGTNVRHDTTSYHDSLGKAVAHVRRLAEPPRSHGRT